MTTTSTHQPATKDRPTYVITLRPQRSVVDPVRTLRLALKVLLRRFGLRAIEAHEDRSER
jgi:hypothetical protein